MTQFDVVGLGVSVLDMVQLVDHFSAQEEVQRADDMTIQGGGSIAAATVAGQGDWLVQESDGEESSGK